MTRCLPGLAVCDGIKDCPSGDDEMDCAQCTRGAKVHIGLLAEMFDVGELALLTILILCRLVVLFHRYVHRPRHGLQWSARLRRWFR